MFKRIFHLLLLTVYTCFIFRADACTGIKLIAKDGSFVHGRTLEFGIELDVSIVVVPRNQSFRGTVPNGQGLAYQSKYGAVGSIAFDNPAILDGMNEKGLAVGTFYFPTYASYTDITAANESKALSPVEFPNWILTQFATVDEVKEALNQVVIAPTVIKSWGPNPPPFHYIVFDRTGKSLVIEPLAGKLVTYENKLGTLTNSPTFDWHMTNLRNYINLTPFNVKSIVLEGVSLEPFGEGSGMVGMPGDFTPPSRFVRAAIFSATATPSQNSSEAIFQLFHILNQFDIPQGAARQETDHVIYTDKTLMTCARDPQTLKYYFKTYEDQAIRVVDLHKFDLTVNKMKVYKTQGKSPIEDLSSELK